MVDEFLGGLPPILVYAVVALLVAAESAFVAGLVLPAATALIAMGLLANAGVVDVIPAILVGVLAALLGGSLAYASGARTGPKLRSRRPDRWERADRLFTRYGGRAVFLGQWVVGARTLVPRLAGINGMRYRQFAVRQMPSGVLWSLWMVGASYLAGASYHVLAARVGQAGARWPCSPPWSSGWCWPVAGSGGIPASGAGWDRPWCSASAYSSRSRSCWCSWFR